MLTISAPRQRLELWNPMVLAPGSPLGSGKFGVLPKHAGHANLLGTPRHGSLPPPRRNAHAGMAGVHLGIPIGAIDWQAMEPAFFNNWGWRHRTAIVGGAAVGIMGLIAAAVAASLK